MSRHVASEKSVNIGSANGLFEVITRTIVNFNEISIEIHEFALMEIHMQLSCIYIYVYICIFIYVYICIYIYIVYNIDGLVQERHKSIANALELRVSCTNPSICNTYGDIYRSIAF